MEREIQKVLVASTGHISREDSELLKTDSDSLSSECMLINEFEHGFTIFISDEKNEDSPDWKYSDALKKLIKLARELDCRYLKLDCDGLLYDDLEQFEW